MNNSVKLALFWGDLYKMKQKLDNELLPVGGFLEVVDSELLESLEKASQEIGKHLEEYRLVGEVKKKTKD